MLWKCFLFSLSPRRERESPGNFEPFLCTFIHLLFFFWKNDDDLVEAWG